MRKIRILLNKTLLLLGFTLINRKGTKIVTVKVRGGIQIKSNRNRTLDYSMDDDGWKILW